jgi:hypothetical protein
VHLFSISGTKVLISKFPLLSDSPSYIKRSICDEQCMSSNIFILYMFPKQLQIDLSKFLTIFGVMVRISIMRTSRNRKFQRKSLQSK